MKYLVVVVALAIPNFSFAEEAAKEPIENLLREGMKLKLSNELENPPAEASYGVYPGYIGGGTVAANFQVHGNLDMSRATGWVYNRDLQPIIKNGPGQNLGGYQYSRTNASGDQIILQIGRLPTVGNVGYDENIPVTATVYLSESTMAHVNTYCGGSPRGIIFPSGAELKDGTISGQVLIVGGNGMSCLYASNDENKSAPPDEQIQVAAAPSDEQASAQ